MTTYRAPCVGMHFRPPAKALIAVLPADHPLLLRPEPTNPYDPNAVAVWLATPTLETIPDAWEELDYTLPGMGHDRASIEAEPYWHLGYMAREAAAQHVTAIQTIIDGQHADADADTDADPAFVNARLGFDAAGKYQVVFDL